MDSHFWKNQTVLVTGHTGFKGSWLSLWLQSLGANVVGYSLNPPTEPSLFERAKVEEGMTSIIGDIRNLSKLREVVKQVEPGIVFHLAAQALVRYSYKSPVETYETNVMGTLNLLESIRSIDSVRAVVLVTSDKCYENREWPWAYRETDTLGGHDPYSSSKGCTEILAASYRNSFFPINQFEIHKTAISTVRSGNVIGGGDWALDRLVPDAMRALTNDNPIQVRNPTSVRPWQHVLEPLSGYLMLAEKLFSDGPTYAQAWNFGPREEDAKSVKYLIDRLVQLWGHGSSFVKGGASHLHETNCLTLECSKAHSELNWWPQWDIDFTLQKVAFWYKANHEGQQMRAICLDQIYEYEQQYSP